MTNPTPPGQVPEALIDLIDAYAETRHRCGGIYNAKTEAARNAVIEALSGVQALSAAPEAFLKSVIALCSHRGYSPANIEAWDKDDKWIADLWRQAESMLAASPTPSAEQQAAHKTAPGVGNSGFDHKTVSDEAVRKFVATSRWAHDERAALSATLLAMHGVLTSREAEIALLKKALMEAEAAPQQEAQEPVAWLNPWRADQVTTDYDAYGEHGIPLYTAPQPAPAPLSERDAFERDWEKRHAPVPINVRTHDDGRYGDSSIQDAWESWQARAALAAQGGKCPMRIEP